MTKLKLLLLIVAAMVLVFAPAFGQQTNAKIVGTVTDNEGNPLPGVGVEGLSPKMVGKATAITDDNGTFRLLSLVPGEYKVVFTLEGFKTLVRDKVSVALEQTINIKVAMEIGQLVETITVAGRAPLIDVKSTTRGMTLTKEVFQSLPKGRNFDSLMTTIPGVSQEPLVAGVSVDGASGLENMYYVDGIDTTNLVSGRSGQNVAFDFVDEVQVKSSGYQAEFGGSLGGVINVVTRSGGNEFHGEVMGFYNSYLTRTGWRDRLNLTLGDTSTATYYTQEFLVGKDKETRFEGGINLGGFIIKDKLWFFGSFLPQFSSNTRTVHHSSGVDKDWKRTDQFMNYQIKLTSQPFKNMRFSASYVNNAWKYKGDMAIRTSDANPAVSYNDYGFSFPNMSASFNTDLTLGNNFMVSLRGGMFRMNMNNPLVQPLDEPVQQFLTEAPGGYFPTTNIGMPGIPAAYQREAGWQNYNRANANIVKKQIDVRYSVNADFTYFLNLGGEHSWKAGVQYVRQGEDYDVSPKNPILFFAWDRDFVAYGVNYGRGTYGYYGVRNNDVTGPNGTVYKAFSNRWALYLQDSWTIKNRLTINAGIRTESEFVPSYATGNPDFENLVPIKFDFGKKLAPRIGFVYDVKGDSSLKIFGNFGLFYDVFKLYMGAGSFGGQKWKSAYYSLDTYEWDKIGIDNYFPGTLLHPNQWIDFRKPSFDTVDPDLKPMSNREISFGLEKKLMENLRFSARLVQKHLRYAIEDVGVFTSEGEQYFCANPGYGWSMPTTKGGKFDSKYWETPKAKREYWGVNLAVDKMFSNNWMGGVSYTWSRLTGNYSGLASGDENGRASPNVERYFDLWYLAYDKMGNKIDGPLTTDRTHSFKLYGSYAFPFGLTAGVVLNAMSGTPVSTEWAMDVQGYLPENRGNLGRTPFLWFTNAYLEYNLKLGKNTLSINLNLDNIFDTKTATRVYAIYNQGAVNCPEDVILAKNWDINTYTPVLDPRYKMKFSYYGTRGANANTTGFDGIGTPLSARLGVKFAF